MQIMDILAAAQGGGAAAALARAYSIEPKAAEEALGALVPRLTDRLERNTLSRGGLADLVSMVADDQSRGYLDHPDTIASPDTLTEGNYYLEQILGSKNASRRMAEKASRETGLDEALLKKLLPAVATMVVGGVSKGAGGTLGEVLSQLGGLGDGGSPLPLPGEPARRPAAGGASGDYTSPSPRPASGGTVPSRPSLPKGQSPLPLPGDDLPNMRRSGGGGVGRGRSPLDDLSDILRRGGRSGGGIQIPRGPSGEIELPGGGGGRPVQVPGGAGGSLWSIIRSILGQVLGFESKGFLSWVLRYIVLKWGVGLIRRILSRLLTGR